MQKRRRFEIPWESRFGAWPDDLVAILSRTRATGNVWSPRAFFSRAAAAGRVSLIRGRGLLASLFVHALGFGLLSHASLAAPVATVSMLETHSDPPPIYLDLRALKELKILRALPVVKPAGSGGRPSQSARAISMAAQPAMHDVPQASTVQNPKFTIIVNPLKPDNKTQAIRQSMAPPDLKIKVDQQVPDIVLNDGAAPAAPKPQVDLQFHQPTASQRTLDAKTTPEPNIAPTVPAPELPLDIAPAANQPKMPASYFASDALGAPHQSQAATPRKTGSVDPSADGAGGIVVLSAQPSAFSQLAALAQGNREGALSIAPSKPGDGSPGGKPNTTPASGVNAAGARGDPSTGVGPGNSGGGGARLSANASFSAVGGSGNTGGVDANGLLSPVLPAAVFPVIIAPKLRRAPLIISAGPIGGGGLDVYGALTCGKVYSIFLPMPGKNWALQYCQHETGALAQKPAPPSAGVVRMEAGIVPPSAEQQFDFRRLPLADKDADKLIILQGMIGTDGGVDNVRVYRGVLSEMDAEAAQAFANWKFKPATRAGVPIAVDVLVGIPARLPENANATPPETSTAR